jgi:hypothetical protein
MCSCGVLARRHTPRVGPTLAHGPSSLPRRCHGRWKVCGRTDGHDRTSSSTLVLVDDAPEHIMAADRPALALLRAWLRHGELQASVRSGAGHVTAQRCRSAVPERSRSFSGSQKTSRLNIQKPRRCRFCCLPSPLLGAQTSSSVGSSYQVAPLGSSFARVGSPLSAA